MFHRGQKYKILLLVAVIFTIYFLKRDISFFNRNDTTNMVKEKKNDSNLFQATTFETKVEDPTAGNVKRHFHNSTKSSSLPPKALDKQYQVLEELQALPQSRLSNVNLNVYKNYFRTDKPLINDSEASSNHVTQQLNNNYERSSIGALEINNLPDAEVIPTGNTNTVTQQNENNSEGGSNNVEALGINNVPAPPEIPTQNPNLFIQHNENNNESSSNNIETLGINNVPAPLGISNNVVPNHLQNVNKERSNNNEALGINNNLSEAAVSQTRSSNVVNRLQNDNSEHSSNNNLPVPPIVTTEEITTAATTTANPKNQLIYDLVIPKTMMEFPSTSTKNEIQNPNNASQAKADFQQDITKIPEYLQEIPPIRNDEKMNFDNNNQGGRPHTPASLHDSGKQSKKQPNVLEQVEKDTGNMDDNEDSPSQNDEPNKFVGIDVLRSASDTGKETLTTDGNEFTKEQNDSPDNLLNIECPDSIQSERQKFQTSPHHCLFYSEFFDTCSEAQKYFPKNILTKTLKCKTKQYKQICEYVNHGDEKRLKCNTKSCGKNTLKIGIFDPKTGSFLYKNVRNDLELLQLIEHERYMQTALAPFVFLTCEAESSPRKKIKQIVVFDEIPSINPEKPQSSGNLPDVNIVVIDSLSRQHFYRVLPETVKVFKSVNAAKSSTSEVLDFKGMQSLAPFTYVNIHALMNGTIDNKNHHKGSTPKRDYPMRNVFAAFKTKGYRTLLQEDSCWHDRWGSLFNGNEKVKDSMSKDTLWKEIQDTIADWNVDDYGMTHITCEALRKYQLTSLFDSTRMLCFNGKPISSYHIDHLLERATATKSLNPLLSYTHINFGHEKTGRRIRGLDENLARLMYALSTKKNTVTFLMSDHGGKQSKYSINTVQGRYEVYDSMLFIIIPKALETTLGENVYKTLLANQNSLVTVLDVRDTILKLLEIDTLKANTDHVSSLFSSNPTGRRDCQAIGIRKYALCKCLSNVNMISTKEPKYRDFLIWLSEYAVGYFNNKLTSYHGGKSLNPRCTRVQAKTIRLAMEEGNDYGTTYTFDVVTKELTYHSDIFNFRVFYNSKRNSSLALIEMNNWNRISIYQKYAFCHDKNVPLDMCICSNTSNFKFGDRSEISEYTQFGVKSHLSVINNAECLILLRRNHGNVVTFEVANLCFRKASLTFGINILYSWQVNQALPIKVEVEPSQIVFIATFLKDIDMSEKLEPTILIVWN